jgi:exonuclease III
LLYDQIWLAPQLADSLVRAQIVRRSHLTGDGSDHDPVWIELRL